MSFSNTQFKAEHGIYASANSTFENDIFVGGSANVAGDLSVGGSVLFTANVVGNFVPDVSGRALGNTNNRWELTANGGNFANVVIIAGNTIPTANGGNLGTPSARWFAYTVGSNTVGTTTSTELAITNNASVSNNLTVSNNVTITSRVNLAGNTFTSNSTAQAVIDAYPAATYRTAKYLVESVDNNVAGSYVACELLLTHNGTIVSLSEYGIVQMTTPYVTYDADITTGSVRLLATSTSTNTTYKVARTLLL